VPRTAFNSNVQDTPRRYASRPQEKGYYHAVVVPVIVDTAGGDKNVVF